MPYSEGGLLDMSAFFERQRRVIFSATLALSVMGGLAVYLDRNNFEGWKPNDWIGAELLGLLLAICAVLAGWGKAALAAMGRDWRHVRSEHFVFCFLHTWLLAKSHGQSQLLCRAEAA